MATAQDVTGLVGIRSDLNARGITNDRIGWDKTTGMVTIDGQNFMKPTVAQGGVSYADPNAFNQAYASFDSGQKARAAEQNFMNAINNPRTNPYDQQVSDFLSQLTQRINNPTPYDMYSDPAYAAYQAQAQRAADKGIRAAQEAYGASGFGRSTQVGERAQNIQNDANEYMELQIAPQLRAAHQAQQQQELGNLFGLYGALTGQQSLMDSRYRDEAQMLSELLGYTTGRADRAQDVQYRTGRDAVADDQWLRTFEENKRQYGEQFAYQQARDAIKDKQWQQQFDEDARRFGMNYALQQQQLRQSAANAAASQRLAESNAARAAASEDFNRAMAVWQATGKAPAGLEAFGVSPGAAYGTPKVDFPSEFASMNAALSSGQITADVAINEINRMVKNGEINAAQAQMLINAATPYKAQQLNNRGVPARTTSPAPSFTNSMTNVNPLSSNNPFNYLRSLIGQ